VGAENGRMCFYAIDGGWRYQHVADIRNLLNAGADKVSMNTSAVNEPGLIRQAANMFGSQCIVVAIDAKRVGNRWEVFTHGGRTATGRDVIEWAREVQAKGAGEILLTSMDADGTKNGFDLPLTKAVTAAVNIPVIASGEPEAWSIFIMFLLMPKQMRLWQHRCFIMVKFQSLKLKLF